MIPAAWTTVLLALAAFRVTRLVGWDDFPPVARARSWVVGAYVPKRGSTNANLGLTGETTDDGIVFRRPVLEHFLHCPYCVGFWISLVAYLAWVVFPTETQYAAMPFALSAMVGITARMLDP